MTSLPANKDVTGAATLGIISAAEKFNRWMYEEIKPLLKGRVLELGSGTGNISRLVLEDKFNTVLSDYNNAYLHDLKKKFSGYPNLEKILSIDLQDPQFEKNNEFLREKFDSIFLLNVIEHLKDDAAAVAHCRYMLKSGGHLILLAPAWSFLFCDLDKNLGHYRRYNIRSLCRLLAENKLPVIEKKYFNLAGISGWFVWGKILRKQQLGQGSMTLFNKFVPFFRFADRVVFKKIGLSAIATGKKI